MHARWLRCFLSFFFLCLASSVQAHPAAPEAPLTGSEAVPRQLQGVGIDEHLGGGLPLDLPFVEDTGKAVHLRDYFDGTHPVIVTMNYSNCPMLCSLELTGLVQAMKQLAWSAGQEFRLITVSFDSRETPATATKTKQRYLELYGRSGTQAGWHFLTGKEKDIRAIADALGFRYRYDEKKDQYYHAAAIAIATPDGHIGRYLYGIQFSPETLRLGLVESSHGKIGTTVDRLILYCCAYDPKEGSYALVANRIMNIGGCLTALALGTFLVVMWKRDQKKKRRASAADALDPDASPEPDGHGA